MYGILVVGYFLEFYQVKISYNISYPTYQVKKLWQILKLKNIYIYIYDTGCPYLVKNDFKYIQLLCIVNMCVSLNILNYQTHFEHSERTFYLTHDVVQKSMKFFLILSIHPSNFF